MDFRPEGPERGWAGGIERERETERQTERESEREAGGRDAAGSGEAKAECPSTSLRKIMVPPTTADGSFATAVLFPNFYFFLLTTASGGSSGA